MSTHFSTRDPFPNISFMPVQKTEPNEKEKNCSDIKEYGCYGRVDTPFSNLNTLQKVVSICGAIPGVGCFLGPVKILNAACNTLSHLDTPAHQKHVAYIKFLISTNSLDPENHHCHLVSNWDKQMVLGVSEILGCGSCYILYIQKKNKQDLTPIGLGPQDLSMS